MFPPPPGKPFLTHHCQDSALDVQDDSMNWLTEVLGDEVPFCLDLYCKIGRDDQGGTRVRWQIEEGRKGVVVLTVRLKTQWVNAEDPCNSSEYRVYAMGWPVDGRGGVTDEVVGFGLGGWLDWGHDMKIVHVTHARFIPNADPLFCLGVSLGMTAAGGVGSVPGVGGSFYSVWVQNPEFDYWDQATVTPAMASLYSNILLQFDVYRRLVWWTLAGEAFLTEHGDQTVVLPTGPLTLTLP